MIIKNDNLDEIQDIPMLPIPFNSHDKIFYVTDDEGEQIGEPYSYQDWIQEIKNMSGISSDLLGKYDDR